MHQTPTLEMVLQARERLSGLATMTPLLRFPALDARAGRPVLVKPETLQRTGSFKFRGACNRIALIPEALRQRGVVACSSGNHAQGVAEAARLHGMAATIVMPEDAPAIKLRRTRELGAEVITYQRGRDDRDAIAAAIVERTGATFIHPFNDPGVIAGQGTVGLEIAVQARAMGLVPATVVACTGGGGLASGIALGLQLEAPEARVFTAEPAGFDDYARSLAAGTRLGNAQASGSVCDAILTDRPGEIAFGLLAARGAQGLVVSDAEALAAVAFAFTDLKLVVEPGGAVALAAVLAGRIPPGDTPVAVVLSGGNVDPQMMQQALATAAA
ncbi:threonine ammonia-lyase [Pannonibacter tanglangensis]|uniref:Pyridoxal-phosphate dependent enzyme n=1 Tax=Pannonibacter tanglangensis TaxID=2750084 RepID=A0ABW9ZGE0_9HYPH|nr:threonine/serine dehydratase [Pannonibacter sp. XCT-34]NBN63496.1 pyridoxal-phosphate dependent enzyme [Pannonibacter sp. XCT-34]